MTHPTRQYPDFLTAANCTSISCTVHAAGVFQCRTGAAFSPSCRVCKDDIQVTLVQGRCLRKPLAVPAHIPCYRLTKSRSISPSRRVDQHRYGIVAHAYICYDQLEQHSRRTRSESQVHGVTSDMHCAGPNASNASIPGASRGRQCVAIRTILPNRNVPGCPSVWPITAHGCWWEGQWWSTTLPLQPNRLWEHIQITRQLYIY